MHPTPRASVAWGERGCARANSMASGLCEGCLLDVSKLPACLARQLHPWQFQELSSLPLWIDGLMSSMSAGEACQRRLGLLESETSKAEALELTSYFGWFTWARLSPGTMVLREDAMSGAELCRHICVGKRVSVLEGRSFAHFTGTSDGI